MPMMPRIVAGFEIMAVTGYRPLNGKMLIEVRFRDSSLNTILMSREIGTELIKAINQADAMVHRGGLPNGEVH